MWDNAHDAYLEGHVLSQDPVALVGLLYQSAIGAVRDARSYLSQGDIRARSNAISRAMEILVELTTSLDHNRGGEIAFRLGQLYDYMRGRLLDANLQQADEPLAEVLGLLATLAEAWQAVEHRSQPAVEAPAPWAHAMAEPESAVGHAWSF